MINWYKRRQRDKRLLADREKLLRDSGKIELYARTARKLKNALITGNIAEAEERKRHLSAVGFVPPQTIEECEQFIKDLRSWHAGDL